MLAGVLRRAATPACGCRGARPRPGGQLVGAPGPSATAGRQAAFWEPRVQKGLTSLSFSKCGCWRESALRTTCSAARPSPSCRRHKGGQGLCVGMLRPISERKIGSKECCNQCAVGGIDSTAPSKQCVERTLGTPLPSRLAPLRTGCRPACLWRAPPSRHHGPST